MFFTTSWVKTGPASAAKFPTPPRTLPRPRPQLSRVALSGRFRLDRSRRLHVCRRVRVGVTGVLIYAANSGDWNFWPCWLIGIISSATDPVAVVALLKDLGAPKMKGGVGNYELTIEPTKAGVHAVNIKLYGVDLSLYYHAAGPIYFVLADIIATDFFLREVVMSDR